MLVSSDGLLVQPRDAGLCLAYPVSYTHLDVYKRQVQNQNVCIVSAPFAEDDFLLVAAGKCAHRLVSILALDLQRLDLLVLSLIHI